MRLSKLIFIILLTVSCSNQNEKSIYFDGTKKVKERIIYTDNENNGNFVSLTYDKQGNLLTKSNFVDYKYHGLSIKYYKNGSINEVRTFKDGLFNGIQRWYNNENRLITETLILDNYVMLEKKFRRSHIGDSISYAYITYRIRDSIAYEEETSIYLDSNMIPIDSLSFYYDINIPDTVSMSDSTTFSIDLCYQDVGNSALIRFFEGPLNHDFTLIDTLRTFYSNNSKNKILGKFKPSQKGYELFTGLIDIEIRDTITGDKYYANMTVYKQVFVE